MSLDTKELNTNDSFTYSKLYGNLKAYPITGHILYKVSSRSVTTVANFIYVSTQVWMFLFLLFSHTDWLVFQIVPAELPNTATSRTILIISTDSVRIL